MRTTVRHAVSQTSTKPFSMEVKTYFDLNAVCVAIVGRCVYQNTITKRWDGGSIWSPIRGQATRFRSDP